ncbi:MAG: hypothetical protein GXP63_04005 [DPANN group archaeon]|nr:hypothetical protein [DPANN group archaeon]
MNSIRINYAPSLITKRQLSMNLSRLTPSMQRMRAAASRKYATDYASLNLPVDRGSLGRVQKLVKEKRKLNPTLIVVAGIGGSNLGTIAVQEAVLGASYNLNGRPRILYADTVDTHSIGFIRKEIEKELRKEKRVILVGVSKSGGTTETIANFSILAETIKRHRKDYRRLIIVTTDKGSRYWSFARQEGYAVLEIPKNVGGRYSVFSPVGLFPLGMLGIDLSSLLKGAAQMRKLCLGSLRNPAAVGAATIYANWKKGKTIHDTFLFAKDLESLGKWYRQLMGESIGKEKDLKGKKVFRGITPTVSIGSTDLHSMAQLYLGGPYDKYHSIITVEETGPLQRVPRGKGYGALVNHVEGKTLAAIMDAIVSGVKAAFIKGRRPFNAIHLPDRSAESIGQLLQLKMMEMMHLGHLLNVNPFDQPNVEDYKIETKRFLEHP